MADEGSTTVSVIATASNTVAATITVGNRPIAIAFPPLTPLSHFNANLAILTGKPSGFGLTAWLTLGSASDGIHPLIEAVTLQIANYQVTIPAGSFHPLWNSPQAPYVYKGAINGTNLAATIVHLGGNNYQFDAAGSPVAFSAGISNPVTVSLTIGDDMGSTQVRAFISAR